MGPSSGLPLRTSGGKAGVPMASTTLSLCLLHPERWHRLPKGPPARSPPPQLLLPLLNALSGGLQEWGPEITESQNHRMVGVGRELCGSSSPTLLLLSPLLAAKSAQHFLYALDFLTPCPANAKCCISKTLPCLVQSYSILSKLASSWSQSQASCLQDGLSSLPTRDASEERWNNIFLLLRFIAGVHRCTDSPVHSCSTLLIEAIFCNILFTLPTCIVTEISLGESSQGSRMITVSDYGSGWNKQESRMWTWWW